MKKALPTGIVNYRELRTNGYYVVDKSMMIKDYLVRKSKVTLITRPRRFGKTLNMSMLAEFFDITKDSKALFDGLAIMETEVAKEMNQYPVVFLSFANAKGDLQETVKFIKQQISGQYEKYSFVLNDINEFEKPFYDIIRDGLSKPNDCNIKGIDNAIVFLMKKLEIYYGKKAMLFIDEYDTPFIEAHVHEYYDELHVGLASLLHSSLKDNEYLQYAMLTGIQRVAKENIFSDLNNLDMYTVKDKEYAQYFGFTKEETNELLKYYALEYNESVKNMYDGYRFGGLEIYNPWSLINYAKRGELVPYWVNTSSNKMIKNAMEKSDLAFKEGYEELIECGYLVTQINMGTSFYEQANTESLWGLFVNAGYLTIEDKVRMDKYRIRIPNNEVRKEFMSLTAHYLQIADTTLTNLFSALEDKNDKKFMQTYESILLRMPSFNDLNNENSYHMMMLGMCAWLQNDYEIISNREEGKGRCEALPTNRRIVLSSKKNFLPSFVIEFKYMKKKECEEHPKALKKLAQEAIQQISKQKYDMELTGEIIHIGLAHAGKDVEMIWKEISKHR